MNIIEELAKRIETETETKQKPKTKALRISRSAFVS